MYQTLIDVFLRDVHKQAAELNNSVALESTLKEMKI